FQSKILRTLHDRASQSELAKCIKEARNNHLKEFQLRNLEHAFEKSFEKYINLNYKNVNGTVNSEVWIGIDLGRTYCSVAIFCRGKVTVLRNSDGRSTTPTYLTLDEKEHPIIGTLAKNRALENPENVVHQGMSIFLENDKNLQSQDDKYRLKPFYENNDELIQLCEKKYTQKEIVAFMIQSLIAQVEKTFGFNVKHVVVATPACISPLKMNAIKSACKMANVESSTIDKPTAVALAYMEKTWCDDMRRILIFDFGGKSLDISIVDIEGENIVLQSTESNTHLGGQFLDDVLLKYCIKKFKDGYKIDPTEDKGFNQTKEYLRLQNSCEDAKIELSLKLSAHIQVNDFHDGKDLLVSVTREQFENEIVSHCESCKDLLDKTLEVKHFKKDDIDDIVLVGGSVYIPKVQKLVAEYFSQQTLCIKMHPDESVAIGAAVKAALLRGAEVMESGSFGAIQEETPISIGIEVYKFGSIGHFEKIIPKKSKIPITQKLVCQTIRNNQEDVVIRVYEGEASMTRYNNLIGELILKGVPPKPAGKELIDIIIEINATDVLHIKALCRNKEIQEELLINVRMPGTESRRVSFNAVDSEDASLNLPTVCHQTAFDKKDPVPQLTNTAEELIQNEVENYVIFMKTKAEELLTFEELETLHLNKSQILLENFKLFNPFPKDSDHYEKLNDTLQHQLTQVFYTISREEIGKSKKCKEKLVKFSELYGYKMNAAKEEDSFYEREELRKIHQSCSHEIMSSFLEEFGDETSEECIKQLERAINVQFVLIDFVNEGGSTLSFSETHVWIKECQAEYKERVKLAQYYKQEEELQKIHTEVLPIVINSFQSKWSTKSRKMCDPEPFIKLLHESIQEAYLQLLTVFSSHKGSLEGKAIKEEKEIPST
ncbi:Heat shock 70 kDa protein 1-like, partial [Orchesella cincta]